jgi:hypothetical protein
MTRFLGIWLSAPLLILSLAAAGEPGKAEPAGAPAGEEVQKPPSPEELAKLQARVAELIKQLGHDEWAKREEATKALVEIGAAAETALEEAAKSKDPEISARAAEALKKIKGSLKRRSKKVNPNCTDGYQPVHEGIRLVQTFKAPAEAIESLRLRAARTINMPGQNLTVELREPGKDKEAALASGKADAGLIDNVGQRTLTRYYQWITVELKAEKLEKGKTYQLVLTAEAAKDVPWLLNCFYRDAYPDGELTVTRDGKPVESKLKFDLVFEVLSGKEDKASSVPKGTDLSGKEDHFGLGPDGTDLHQPPPEAQPVEGGADAVLM